jgi:hypothetical protein
MTNSGTAAPGWYADPSGSGALRWWDGYRWTDQLAGRPNPTPYAAERRQLPPGTSVDTVWIWLAVLLPLLSVLMLFLLHPQVMFRTIPGTTRLTVDPFALMGGPLYFAVIGVGWLVTAAVIVFSWLDYRELVHRGVERPFHWAWAFLGIVYVIGRTVIVRRVTGGHGMGPLWGAIAVNVVAIILAVVWSVMLFAQIMETATSNPLVGA